MDASFMEVRFDIYCKKCKHEALQGNEDPCSNCISRPFMYGTDVPKLYAEKPPTRGLRTKNKRYSAKTISK